MNGTDVPAMVISDVAGVIGSGINLQSVTGKSEIDTAMESLIEWHGEVGNIDITKKWHMSEFWRQAEQALFFQNGLIVRHHYDVANPDWVIPYKMELVGIDMIDNAKNDTPENVRNGIRKDKYGAVTGLYIYDTEKRTSTLYDMENMDYIVIGWVSLSQYTAISRLVTILPTIDSKLIYTDAEVKSATDRAKNGVFWHTELYGVIMKALDEAFEEEGTDARGRVKEAKDLMNSLAKKGTGIDGVMPTPKEDKMTVQKNETSTVYDTITDQSQKAMASASGGSQVSTYGDISKGNYSSIQADHSSMEEKWKIAFNNFEHYIVRPYLKRLFKVGVQTRFIPLSIKEWMEDERSFYKWDVLRTSKRSISPKDAAKARETNLKNGSTTHKKEYGERGLVYKDEMLAQTKVDIELELEKQKMYEDAGLPYPGEEVEVVPSSTNTEVINAIDDLSAQLEEKQ